MDITLHFVILSLTGNRTYYSFAVYRLRWRNHWDGLPTEHVIHDNNNSGVPRNVHVVFIRVRQLTASETPRPQTDQLSPRVGEVLLARESRSSLSSQRILLVDDDSDVLVSLGGWLEAAEMDAVRASSGAEALSLLRNGEAIDAVVTDIMMPGMSGVEFLVAVWRIRPILPALVITGYADFAGANELPSSVPVMLKPFRRKEFISRVQSLLSGGGARAERR